MAYTPAEEPFVGLRCYMSPQDTHTRTPKLPSNLQRRLSRILLLVATLVVLSLSLNASQLAATNGMAMHAWRGGTALRAQSGDARSLVVGETVEREIRGGETHLFGVQLEAGQYARLVLRRQGVDLLVTVAAPDRRTVTTHENPAGTQSLIAVSVMAVTPGIHVVEVRPVEKWAASGRYKIQLEGMRSPGPADEKRLAAERKVAEGRRQQLLETEGSRRAAIASYEEALALWRELADRFEEANTLHFIAETYKELGRNYFKEAVDNYQLALLARRDGGDRQAEAYTLLGLADLYLLGNPASSLSHYQQALELFEAGNNRRGQAAALYGRGLAKQRREEKRAALADYEQALSIYQDTRDRHGEARTLHAMGGAYDDLGEPERALEFYDRAFAGWRETGDLAREGNTYSSVAKINDDRGRWQTALDNYDKALELYARGEAAAERGKAAIRNLRASTLYNHGFTYAALGDYSKAFELLEQSLALRDDPRGKGITLMMIGYVHALAGDPQKALEFCLQALPLQEEAGDPRKSQTLTVMGVAHAALGEHKKALEFYNQALLIQQNEKTRAPQAEAITQGWRGESLAALGVHEEALASYARARELWLAYNELNGAALALAGMARVERDRNNLAAALRYVEDALAAIEPLRANVTSQNLRASYFAAKVGYYELYIDLSMRLRDRGNHAALTAAAFEASERARARSLLDMLSLARVEAGLQPEPPLAALVDKYRSLQKALHSKKMERRRTPKEKEGTEGVALGLEISKLSSERDHVEAQIRSQFPRFAALMYPQPLTAGEVQQLLDEDTLLLEFILGEERSYLWALTPTELHGHPLPPRSEIEGTARRLVELLRAGQPLPTDTAVRRKSRMVQAEAEYWRRAAAFSRTLLGPVAPLLKKKRLLIVTDGQLRYLPFAALPSPGPAAASGSTLGETPLNTLLVRDHEIVNLPSASVLSVLRQTARRDPASKSVAVFADPVFEKDDPRIQLANHGNAPTAAERRDALKRAIRDVAEGDDASKLPRLPATGQEARDIVSVAPPGSSMEATGFKANRENATSAQLSRYRVVHFATHGILNEKNPELSGIVLSLYDEQGRFREEGFLRLSDIYGLSLPVDLVVLSACRTGLGKEVKGEGLIGLTRGFMYAGASRVIASLWKIDDEATAELMKRFYQKMLRDGMTPAAALREAQASMLEQRRWSNPYYWSGFILQGESK